MPAQESFIGETSEPEAAGQEPRMTESGRRYSRQRSSGRGGAGRQSAVYEDAGQAHSRWDDTGWKEFRGEAPVYTDTRYGEGVSTDFETNGEVGKPDEPKRRRQTRRTIGQYRQNFRKEAEAEEPAAFGEGNGKPSKLVFTSDELPPGREAGKFLEDGKKAGKAGRRVEKAERKAGKLEQKLQKAEGRLPSRRKLRIRTISDPETGKAGKRLRFEKEVKAQKAHVKGPVPLRPVKAGANAAIGYAHKKVYQAEDENVGIKAVHRTELAGEAGARIIWCRHKTAPYRRVEKLRKRSARASANAAYRQTLHGNPGLGKNLFSRMWQKKKLKRQYAKAARKVRETGRIAKDAAVTTERFAAGIAGTVKRHPVICVFALILLLVLFMAVSLVSSFSSLGTGSLGGIVASSYLAEDQDIDRAELAYTEWETDLQMEINRVEADRPGYDEYRYQVDAIEHDPYELMGYLTSIYQDFFFGEIEGELRELFDAQYSLVYTEETEIRYRTEIMTDPETGEETEIEVPYEWHILNVKLSAVPLGDVTAARMDSDQKEICEILLSTKGCRQYVGNIFGGAGWLPYVTGGYGYRVHPDSGEKDYHTGVDIGMPHGTDILAGHDGRVAFAGNTDGYGLCVTVEGRAYGEHTLATRYGHCSRILVSAGQEVRAGDVIAKVGGGGDSAGSCLHLEVMVDGQYLNPLYFAETGDTGDRRLPAAGPGGGGNYLDYGLPPEALSNERFAAMIAEAEKYLGCPYVWGGSSPSTSFDCSGYVSWVVNHSGWDVGRLTADGLLGVCAPVSGADARPGDLIFFKGTYNTSGASHVGIYVGGGMMIHCGDPISYANINTSYWQSHFYTFGRLP